MKIIHITPSYKPAYIYGGPILSVSKLCETMASNGHDVEVYTTTANGKIDLKIKRDNIEGVDVIFFRRIAKDPFHFSPALVWALYMQTQRAGSNLTFHIHSWWNLVAITSCILARVKKIPVILSPRGMLTEYSFRNRNVFIKKIFHKLLGRHLIAYCNVHATSELERDDISKLVQPKSICVIPNFVNSYAPISRASRRTNNISANEFKLLFLSRIEEKKGLELLFYTLAKCDFSWRLTIAGTGEQHYLDKLKQLAHLIGISELVIWVGHIPENDKYDVMSNHHLLVLLSYNENFANVVMESLSVGTAVGVSDMVGVAHFVKKFDLGWVTSLDPRHVVHMLSDACENHQKRTSIVERAPSIVRTYFNEHAILKQYQDLYKI